MTKTNQSKLQALIAVLLALLIAAYCTFYWRGLQDNKQDLQGVVQQLNSSLMNSQSLGQHQEQFLQVLNSTQHLPLVEPYTPEYWLSELQADVLKEHAVSGFSARLLVDKQNILGRYSGQEIFVTPIDYELLINDLMQTASIIRIIGQTLGSYSSVDYCGLQRREITSDKASYRLQCRIGKIAYREVDL